METKKCKKCGGTDFAYGQCRPCRNAAERERVKLKGEHHREVCRRWKQLHHEQAMASVVAWTKNPEHRKQVRAMWRVRRAIKDGRLVPADRCSICGKHCKTQAHHQSYDRPLEVDWVCRGCQIAVHNAVREIVRTAQKDTQLAKAS